MNMSPQTLIEVLEAAHLTSFITGCPFEQRGGIMIVGPPGILKTSFIETALSEHPNALILSDLNVNSLMKLRESLISGRYKTIAFPEFEKLYQRKADTASNVEATIKQLVEEGFTRASFEEQDAITFKARTLVIGAMTSNFYDKKIGGWREQGFKRRFLWVAITLLDPNEIMKAIRRGKKLELNDIYRRYPTSGIPLDVDESESKKLEAMLSAQWQATPYVLLKKIYSVLKWKYKNNPERPMQIMQEFSESIRNTYAHITLVEGKHEEKDDAVLNKFSSKSDIRHLQGASKYSK
jgi:hypothetical protein